MSTRCECTVQDNPTRLVRIVMLRHYMKDRGLVMGQVDRTQENSKDLGKPRVRRGSEHRDQKRPTPELIQGIKRAILCPRFHLEIINIEDLITPPRDHSPLQVPHIKMDTRQGKPPTEGSRQEESGQYDKARETRTTTSGTNRAAEKRPVQSKQAIAVRPCHYYLRSRVKQPEGIPEEHRNRQYPVEQHQEKT
ncbi:uncharacterized protein TNCV_4964281 [Trichonephila clavipes]|nr:uncharacterized protein TNCV_4964281 [Trichonephila clavipes]